MDELAHAAGKDTVQFRLDHMEKGSRAYNVLSLLAEKGGVEQSRRRRPGKRSGRDVLF